MREIFRSENKRLRQEDDQLRAKLDELHGKLEKQQEQMVKLQRENQKLRRVDSKIKEVIRQRDQNDTHDFDTKIRNSLRHNKTAEELMEMMRNEINNFLINEKICVGGVLKNHGAYDGRTNTVTVPFGRTFPRKPTVVAALSYVNGRNPAKQSYANTWVVKATSSTADILVK